MTRWMLLVVVVGACTQDVAGDATAGVDVYAKVCAMCHGPLGKPTTMMAAKLGVRDLTSPALRARITAVLVEHQVRAGSQNKRMPALAGALSDDQIRAVAAYVASPEFLSPR